MNSPHKSRWTLAVLWALSLVVVASIVASAQRPEPMPLTNAPTLVAGPDIGFRIERTENGVPTGRLVILVDGTWVDARLSQRAAAR